MTINTPETILVATDLSERSDEVVRAAAGLAGATGASLHLLHAFDLVGSPRDPDARGPATFDDRLAAAERALVEQLRRVAPDQADRAGVEVVIRSPAQAIIEAADALDADLVVIGPHNRRRIADALLGSTADGVVRAARVPCLIVRGPLALPLRRLVVPDDRSEHAAQALELALRWGVAFGPHAATALPDVELHVIHVVRNGLGQERFPFDMASIGPDLVSEVEATVERVEHAGQLEIREEVLWGDDPAGRIAEFAGSVRAELLVLGTLGRSALQRTLLGSVASAVARRAPCPVLLVPRDLRASQAVPSGSERSSRAADGRGSG